MIDYSKLNPIVVNMPPSGIRRFFDLAATREGVVSLGVGEPDFPTPLAVRQEAIKVIEECKLKYTSNQGLIELRQEICHYVKRRFDLDYTVDNCLLTIGGSEAVDIAFRTILQPGDEVIVLTPGYVSYEPCVLMAQGTPVCVELREEDGFRLTKERLAAAITSKTKAILMNFPGNPTGGVMTYEDYAQIVPLIQEHDLYVVSDEIYAELTYEGNHASIANFPEIKEKVILINGFSKGFSMTGWRLGYILADQKMIKLLNKVHQYAIMCAPTISQYAAIVALTKCDEEVVKMRESFKERRDFLVKSLNDIGLKTAYPKGAFYVFPNITCSGLTSEEFCERLLEEQNVACVPGTAFGKEGEGFIRISYAYSLEQIKKAVERIGAFLHDLENHK
ncbi:MAG: aminotransferase class I/II-fold pyridoxal phosphate-dependent enzyme [Erysipelotrichaceae bacterium]|nr:aminotransferase class I/II-fold pyridoxal phosphate-dependent enzyme [Erysipelotrichaceae bacterium]